MIYALASLVIPGLGQFLQGRRVRGLGLFGLILLMIGLVLWAVTPSVGFSEATIALKGDSANWWWLIVPAIIWLWTIWDAASPQTPRSQWIPALAGLIMFYTLGWQASGLNPGALFANFDRGQLVLRPMLQPDFLQARAERLVSWVELQVPCSESPLAGTNTLGSTTLTLSAGCATVGDTLAVTGSGFWPSAQAELVWQSPIGDFFPLRKAGTTEAISVQTDANGKLTMQFVVPNAIPPGIDPNLPQEQRLYIRQSHTIGGFGFSFESCLAQLDSSYPPPKIGPGYELSINGCFVVVGIYQTVALALMAEGVVDLAPLVTHKFKLGDYRRALASVASKGRTGVIKAVFAF